MEKVTPEILLTHLPPFRNERILVKKDQRVNDIIEQILKAHEKYAHYYSNIANYFDAETVDKICDNIYFFIQKNIQYREESDREQTTALPSAILTLKYGDCKHYSSFAAGILDALKRNGKKINWCYRFCSYKLTEKTPHHVFVVVKKNDGEELWIDAVPGANELTPLWQLDKTVKNFVMPLYDVVGNVQTDGGNLIGWTTQQKLMHAAAKINPTFIAGRAAFLQMLKWNVRAWAKNIQDLTNKLGLAASDPIGTRWYLFGGDSAPFWSAVKEGSTKKMIGNTIGEPVSIVALLTAAAPIVIALTTMVKSLAGKEDWDGMTPLYPTTGTTYPPTGTGGASGLLSNPMVLAGGAALAYYLYSKNKSKVSGTDNTLLLILLLGGGYMLYKNSQQQPPVLPDQGNDTTEPVLIDAETGSGEGSYPMDENLYNEDGMYKEIVMDYNIPIEAMM